MTDFNSRPLGIHMPEITATDELMIEQAKIIAERWHALNEPRWFTDEPYIEHPKRVAELVRRRGGTPWQIAAAWLHDVVEDAAEAARPAAITEIGRYMPERVVRMLDFLTRADGTPYEHYVAVIARHPEAKLVKYCDTLDNISTLPFGHDLSSRYTANLVLFHAA